jgi:transposase
MSDIEIITDCGRRRRRSWAETLRIVEETLEDGARISIVARPEWRGAEPARIVGPV